MSDFRNTDSLTSLYSFEKIDKYVSIYVSNVLYLYYFQYYAKRLPEKKVSKMTYFVSSET